MAKKIVSSILLAACLASLANFLYAQSSADIEKYYGTWANGYIHIMGGKHEAEFVLSESSIKITKGVKREYTYLTWTKDADGNTVVEGRDARRKDRKKPVVAITFKQENGEEKAFLQVNALTGFLSTGLSKTSDGEQN